MHAWSIWWCVCQENRSKDLLFTLPGLSCRGQLVHQAQQVAFLKVKTELSSWEMISQLLLEKRYRYL